MLRVAPRLFGLLTVVAALYVQLPVRRRVGGVLAGQARRNILGRPDGGSPVAMGGMGFCNSRS